MATPKLKKGETLIGLTLHEGKPHHLILLAGDEKKNWKDAVAWAKKKGGVLPSRIDMLVLFERAAAKFEKTWYWTSQEYTGAAGYAWGQFFGGGSQGCDFVSNDGRARAVRRVPI
jgi:hypothetical protein